MRKYVRVYNNGDRVYKDLAPWEAEIAIAYDKDHRPGCAVFIDGECKQAGYLDMERLVAIGRELSDKK
jgi:hypothetical protein